MQRSAIFSDDGLKRFQLIRDWSNQTEFLLGPQTASVHTVLFVMLNPSKADGKRDDLTVTKCIGFAKRWGYNRLVICNIIPYVSTDPSKLPPFSGIDMENRAILQYWLGHADLVVAAWGTQPNKIAKRIDLKNQIKLVFSIAPIDWYCIGTSENHIPRHPSRASYTNRPLFWKTSY